MSQSDISGNVAREPNFLEPAQNVPSSGTKTEASASPEYLVEPLAELAPINSPSAPQPPSQQEQKVHCLPAVSQGKATLLQELEAARQMLQHQQTLTESLTEELITSRECIAQMERDLARLQQHYDEQRHLLKHTEANHQDLRARLHRQQRQALQYKAALEKCLDNSPLQNESNLGWSCGTAAISQPLQGTSIDYGSTQRAGLAPIETFGIVDSSSLDCASHHSVHIGLSSLSVDIMQHRASLEETDNFQEITALEDKPMRPSFALGGQPVQPWSALRSGRASGSTGRNQPERSAACASTSTTQATEVEASSPSQRGSGTSTPATRSSPLLDPLQPAGRRKSRAKIELPSFSRRRS